MSIFGSPVFQHGTGTGGVTTDTPAFTTAAGDLIVVAVGCSDDGTHGSGAITSVTDTAGNVYTALTSEGANLGARMQLWHCLFARPNASNVIRAHFAVSQTFSSIAAWDVPITAGANAEFDVQAVGNDGGSNSVTAFATASFSTTGIDEIVFAAIVNDFETVTYSAGSGYTLDDGHYPVAAPVSGAEHRIFSSTQAGITATITGGSNADGALTAAALKPAGSPKIVQQAQDTNDLSPFSVAFPSANTAGNSILVAIAAENDTVNAVVTDTKGNSYSKVVESDTSGLGTSAAIYRADNILAGANTVNVTSHIGSVIILETTPLGTVDQIGTANDASGTTHAGPTVTTGQSNELCIAMCSAATGNSSFPGSAKWSGFGNPQGMLQHQSQDSAGSITGNFTTNATVATASAIATFPAPSGATTVNNVHNVDAYVQATQDKTHNIDAFIQAGSTVDQMHNVDADILVPAQVSEVHNVDAYVQIVQISHSIDADIIVVALVSFVRFFGSIIFPINPTNGFVRLAGTVLEPQLSFVNLAATIEGKSLSFINLAGTVQVALRNYVKLAGNISSDKTPTHHVDADISTQSLSFVQMVGTIVGAVSPGPCTKFPDASYVKLAGWIVIPGDSVQMPNSGFSRADDFLSSQVALQAYKPMSIISLAGYNLIITAFTAGVFSWQTRARTWLTRQDEIPNGILLTTTTSVHTLPNGAIVTTVTQVKLVQDVQVTIVTIKNSATPQRTSVIVTEKNQSGQTVTRETDTTNVNGVISTQTKKTVYTQPPDVDNIQPITVRTLDGVTHYQFFDQVNTEWAGGDQEGVTQTQTQETITPGSLNGKTQDQFGNPILTRISDTIVNDPTGKLTHTHTEETGIRGVGTTTTDTQDSFNGIIETTIATTTFPDGSQEVKKRVKNSLTGDTTETSTEQVTDEFGQITTTVTHTEIKTFADPVTGALRQVTTKTVNVTKSGVNTVDSTVVTTDNFEDVIINDKIRVIAIQEFTITCVIDEFTMFALWEINESHQKQYALQELFGQQLGNANLSYALRQRLIGQFNAANCVPCVNLQANGRTWCVVFAPSASAFRPKLILGTEPHVYELQLIVQARSNLIDGTIGF
jgi:hypothetical protein